jgi:hemerythrin-like metal-binding protein
MTYQVPWDATYVAGNDVLDSQHKAILVQCNALADCTINPGTDAEQQFRVIFGNILTSVRAHFSAEEALLADAADPDLDGHRDALAEFEELAADVITTDRFEMSEIQRFLTLWWVGHLVDSAKKYRGLLEL